MTTLVVNDTVFINSLEDRSVLHYRGAWITSSFDPSDGTFGVSVDEEVRVPLSCLTYLPRECDLDTLCPQMSQEDQIKLGIFWETQMAGAALPIHNNSNRSLSPIPRRRRPPRKSPGRVRGELNAAT